MYYLIYSPNTAQEKKYKLNFGINTIGRNPGNSIVILDEGESRYHAEITVKEQQIFIQDKGSVNHTFINDVKIEHCQLKVGDLIRCANSQLKLIEEVIKNAPTLASIPEQIVKKFALEPSHYPLKTIINNESTEESIVRLHTQNKTQQTVDKFKILLEVSNQLSSPTEPEDLLNKILDLLFEILDIDRAAILMVSDKTNLLECKAAKSKPGISVDEQFYSVHITDSVYKQGNAILITDASQDERFCGVESVLRKSIHASMCIPLKPREKVIGVLYVDNLSMSDVYSDEDMKLVTALANQVAIAIDNSQLYKTIEAEAIMRNKLERFFPTSISQKLKEEDSLEIIETEVTALFSDISGFTKMSSTMEPRQVIAMLNEYFEVMVEQIVFKYEGTLEKYIGDALFAIWGAPYQKKDDPERAIQSAIEMQWAVQDLNQKWQHQGKQPIQIHIGINTGQVAAGNIGSKKLIQYATIGDTTNMTSRICNVAKAGEIIISQSTFDRLEYLKLPFLKMIPVKVKGKQEPLQLYSLMWQQIVSKQTIPLTN